MGEITGRKVFLFTAGAFGVIIAVNLVMAWKAISTFPGLEVKNSYVASQTFDEERAAQERLGWTLTEAYDPAAGTLSLAFRDAAGQAVEPEDLTVLVGRTTVSRDDVRPAFALRAGRYEAPVALQPGRWMLLVEAWAADGTLFRKRLELFVRG